MGPSDLVDVAGCVVSQSLAPDHMLGFGIGRNIVVSLQILGEFNKIRIMI